MVLFDSTILLLFLYPEAKPPLDPATQKPLEFAKDRISGLIQSTSKERSRVLIPTPVLSEILIKAGPALSGYLNEINANHVFHVADFDQKSAVELALLVNKQLQTGQKRHDKNSTWAKIKFDQQIVAIAKANGVDRIYSDDDGIFKSASLLKLPVVRSWELPIPEGSKQANLDLHLNESITDEES